MKSILSILAAACLFASCSNGPKAGVELSNPTPGINETFRVVNTSEGGDITYVKMQGEGVMNKYIQIAAGAQISAPRFNFKYTKYGKYTIEVVVENSSTFGGSSVSTHKIPVNIVDPDAIDVVPPTKPVNGHTTGGSDWNN